MRACHQCSSPIMECMGYVNAGDWNKLSRGEITGNEVREICGLCVLRHDVKSGEMRELCINTDEILPLLLRKSQ